MKIRFKILFTLFIILTLANNIKADNIKADIDVIIFDGLNLLYNVNFPAAKDKFREAQSRYPHEIKGLFYESLVYFYEAVITRDDNKYDDFLEMTDAVLDKCELQLDDNENNLDALYMKGQTHSYRSLLMLLLNKNLIRAATNGNDGYKTLELVVQTKPDYYDAYMGLGLFKIALGYVPDKFKWLLEIIGFKGNISDGREYLRKAMEYGYLTKTEARTYLAVFSLRERELKNTEAIDLTYGLIQQFPNSPFFNLLYGVVLTQNGKPSQAIDYLKKSIDMNSYELKNFIRKTGVSLLGNAYFSMNDFSSAVKYLEEYSTLVEQKDKTNISMFTLGISCEMLGDRQKALKYYNSVKKDFIDEKDGETEKLFYRLAKDRVNKKITPMDSLTIIAMNYKDSEQHDKSKVIFKYIENSGLLNTNKDDDTHVRFYYEYGRLMFELNELQKAISLFEKAIILNPKSEKWLVPHSYFELGKIYHKQGNYKKAGEMFEKISEFDDFDLEQFLDMRITNFLKNN